MAGEKLIRVLLAPLLIVLLVLTCSKSVRPFSAAHVDRSIGTSRYPTATNPSQVGQYPGQVKSGAGFFYDDVLEYRVWLHPERGAQKLAGDSDYYAAFAQYEPALHFSKVNAGSEEPLVLVRQKESVNEPTPGKYEWVREERITEWQVDWLKPSRREPDSIKQFLATHAAGHPKVDSPRPNSR